MLDFFTNRAAFTDFIQQYQDQVFRIVLPVVQHEADAEEITQDVFVEVYQTASSFRGDAAVSTWLYRIAMNKCIDHLRKKNRKKRFAFLVPLFNPGTQEPVADGGTDFYHPGVAAENKEKAVFLFKALKQLPEKQRIAWVLFEMEQLDYRQIREVLGASQSAVESLLFRARQNLRKLLEDDYGNR